MAKIQMGVIVTDIRGKLAGNQFSKTRAGNILQRKCQQRKGATAAQSVKRGVFSENARYWRTLTDVQRLSNNTNTSSYPVLDKFGNVTYLSGYQLLLRSNINRIAIGELPIQVVPATPPAGAGIGSIILDITSSGGVIVEALVQWDSPTGDYANKVIAIYASPGVSAGISIYSGRYVLYQSNPAPSATMADIAIMFENVLAIPGVGDRVFIIVDLIDIATGIVVNSYTTSNIVVNL